MVGGGFAGLEAATRLAKAGVEVHWVSGGEYFQFLPGLPALVSGRMRVSDLQWGLRGYAAKLGVKFTPRRAVRIVSSGSMVVVEHEGGVVEADAAVVAWGAEPAFFGVPGAAEYAVAPYTAESAAALHEKLGKARSLVVVGAGLVGCEVAGEAAWAASRGLLPLEEVHLVDLLPEPLAALGNARASKLARRILEGMGVKLHMPARVEEVEPDAVVLKVDGGRVRIAADAVAWAAGLRGRSGARVEGARVTRRGFIVVDETLRAVERVYVAGDAAHVEVRGEVALKMVREALRQARTAAANAMGASKTYKPLISDKHPVAGVDFGPENAILVLGRRLVIKTNLVLRYKEFWRRRYAKLLTT